jgi:hypothetical protein
MADKGINLETGDTTYQERYRRWEYVMGRLKDNPRPTYEQIGSELGISKQNVGRIVARGEVKPSGRQRTNAGRIQRLGKRLQLWNSRRAANLVAGATTEVEDRWIADLSGRIKVLRDEDVARA